MLWTGNIHMTTPSLSSSLTSRLQSNFPPWFLIFHLTPIPSGSFLSLLYYVFHFIFKWREQNVEKIGKWKYNYGRLAREKRSSRKTRSIWFWASYGWEWLLNDECINISFYCLRNWCFNHWGFFLFNQKSTLSLN